MLEDGEAFILCLNGDRLSRIRHRSVEDALRGSCKSSDDSPEARPECERLHTATTSAQMTVV